MFTILLVLYVLGFLGVVVSMIASQSAPPAAIIFVGLIWPLTALVCLIILLSVLIEESVSLIHKSDY